MSLKLGLTQNIRSGHDRMKGLVDSILTHSGKEKQQRELYRELRREITLHSMLAEDTIYQRLKSMPHATGVLRALRVQHAGLEGFVNKLDVRAFGGAHWFEALCDLKIAVREHLEYEEMTLLPLIRSGAAA